jgi:type III restriction enzyme
VTPRAALAADRFSADQLLLRVSESVDPDVFDLAAYGEFIDAVCGGRDYQREAVQTVLRLFCGGRYQDTEQLARESFDGSPDLQRLYPSADALVERLPFPDKLSCSLDLATGTGKSFAMYAIARIMLNEGLIDRVLVLCPSLTIEAGLMDKFKELTADGDLTDLLPLRPGGHPLPTIVTGAQTVKPGDICIENRHAAYENAGSSLADSFLAQGHRTLVLSDEAHHVISVGGQTAKKWHDFIADLRFGFRWHLGVSGTCYVGNEYFADVVYRYAVRDAINDGWVKEVFYLAEDDSTHDDERFQKLLAQHEKNRKTYKPIKPLTIAVTKDIKGAERLAGDLVAFLARQPGIDHATAEARVLVVTSSSKHQPNLLRLRTVDEPGDPAEWIVSVSMLTEGWDVKNVFQIYPHQKRAFDSKLLISQVLGRGLRRPAGYHGTPVVHVFNHQRWGQEIDDFVAEILDQETVVSQTPVDRDAAPHFELHDLIVEDLPQTVTVTKLETNKRLDSLKLSPQIDAEEETKFVSATDATRASVLTTRITERLYDVEDVVEDVREKLLAHDKRTGGDLAVTYPKAKVREMIIDALKGVGADGTQVTQENRLRILNSFGGLRQRTAKSTARLQTKATGLKTVSTKYMRPVRARLAGLTKDVGMFTDELTQDLSSEEDRAALAKAEDMPDPKNVYEVGNAYDFKTPVNLVLTDHQPERRFAQKLLQARNAKALRSWVKAPDTGFYEIEYAFQEGGVGRSKRGRFNLDFFLWLKDQDTVVACEVKADGDDSWRNKGKMVAAHAHFAEVNRLLEEAGEARRYVVRIVTPKDYDKFLELIRAGEPEKFVSGLQGVLDAKKPAGVSGNGGRAS